MQLLEGAADDWEGRLLLLHGGVLMLVLQRLLLKVLVLRLLQLRHLHLQRLRLHGLRACGATSQNTAVKSCACLSGTPRLEQKVLIRNR